VNSDFPRLLVRGGALLVATAAVAWIASLGLTALKPLLGHLLAPVPVWQFAAVAWAGVLCIDKFAPKRLRPLRVVVVCWAIGLSLAAGAEFVVGEWAVSDDALHRFEETWVDARAGLDWLLRYNLLAAALTTMWVLALHAKWSSRYLTLSLKAIGYGGRVLMVLSAAATFSFFTAHAADAVAAESFHSRQTEAVMVLREAEDAVASERARHVVEQRIKHDPHWAANFLRGRIEAMVQKYGPRLCTIDDSVCRPALGNFTLRDAAGLAPDDAAQVKLLLENIGPGQSIRIPTAKPVILPDELARPPRNRDEIRAQQIVLEALTVRRNTAEADDHEAQMDLHRVSDTVALQVVRSLDSVMLAILGADAASGIIGDSAEATFDAVAETVMRSPDGRVPDNPVIGTRIRDGATLPLGKLVALLGIRDRGIPGAGMLPVSGEKGGRNPSEIIDRAPPHFR
jgi:hypothetical protein